MPITKKSIEASLLAIGVTDVRVTRNCTLLGSEWYQLANWEANMLVGNAYGYYLWARA